MKANLLVILSLGFLFSSTQLSNAATFNWIGGNSTNFSQANNWHENAVPGSSDIVQIGVTYSPTRNTPILSTAGTTNIAQLVIGTNYSNTSGTNPIGITVNSGSTLKISGDINFTVNALISSSSSYYISGGGSITAANMYINATGLNLGLSLLFNQQVNCAINSLVLSGNLSLISQNYVILFSQAANFNLTAGTTEVDGTIATTNNGFINTFYPSSSLVINPSSAAGATLQLNGAAALSGLSSVGTNNIVFNNTYANVNYAGATQKVYTNTAPNIYGGVSYYDLTITGSGTETAASGTLTVSHDLKLTPTVGMSFNLNTNTTVSSITMFSSNSLSTLIQGSGQNFVVADSAINAGTINLVGNSSMIFNGVTGLTNSGTISGLSGYANQQNITVSAGPLTNSGTVNWYGATIASTFSAATVVNSGTINVLSSGTFTSAGQVTNSGLVNKTNGVFKASAGYTNTNTGVFRGTTATGTTGYTSFKGNFINNDSLKCNAEPIYFDANYTNNAAFVAGSGMVYFAGSTQALIDNSTPGTVFNNVTFKQSGTATISQGTGNFGVFPAGSLYMVSPARLVAGSTTTGGAAYLTIMSSAASTATVYTPSNTAISGNVNVQRYITSGTGSRGYRLLASPVNVSLNTAGSGNVGLSYLGANLTWAGKTYYGAFTEGPGTGFVTNGSTNPIIYLYDESRPTDNSSFVAGKNIGVYSITGSPAYSVTTLSGKPAVTTAGVSVPVGNSYLFYFVGSNQSTVVSATRTPDSTTLTSTGYLNQGSVPVKFWKTGSTAMPYDVTSGTTVYGLSQVGNPYAATINLITLYSENYNATTNPISAAFYELIPGGNYVSYNAANGHVSDSRASQYIVSGQGFMMQTSASNQTLTFSETQKVGYNSSAAFLESFPSGRSLTLSGLPANNNRIHNDAIISPVSNNPEINTGLHLQLAKDTASYAQTGIYFSTTGSDAYKCNEDAMQVDGGTPAVYLSSYSSDSVKLSINTMAGYSQGKRIRLYANAVSTGTYTMSLYDITQIDTTNYNVYLLDKLKNDSVDMVHSKSYAFDLNTSDTTTFGANRFVLEITHRPVGKYVLATFTGQKVTAGVQLNWTAQNAGNYTGYTLQKLNSSGGYDSLYSVQSDTSVTAYTYTDKHPIIGNNTYRLKQNGFTCAITYSALVTIGYNSTTPNGALTLYPNPASGIMHVNLASGTINTPAYTADIYNSMGERVSEQSVSGAAWTHDVSNYKLGIYVMQIKDANGYVIGTAKFMKVR